MNNIIQYLGVTKRSIGVVLIPMFILSFSINQAKGSQGTSQVGYVNGQKAGAVLGEPDFTSYTGGSTIGPNSMERASGIAYDSKHHRLFIADWGSFSRILVFNIQNGIQNNMNASYVLGKPDFTTTSWASPSNLSGPNSLIYDDVHQYLYVSDSYNDRVVIYDLSGSLQNGMAPVHVLGQPDLSTTGGLGTASQSNLVQPMSMAYDPEHQRLFVADWFRVMVWDIPGGNIVDGMPATYELGQPAFDSHLNPTSTTDNTFQTAGLAYDTVTKKLFVSDAWSQRVMVFNLANGITNNMSASNVLGQPDLYTHDTYSLTGTPNSVYASAGFSMDSANQRLFVNDWLRNRILIFALQNGITDNMNASAVLGQTDFAGASAANPPTQTSENAPQGVYYEPTTGLLFVSDWYNQRTMVYGQLQPGCGSSTICGTITAAEDVTINLAGVPVELRDGRGKLVTTKKTDSAGTFNFGPDDGVTADENYTVAPVVKWKQSSDYMQISTGKLPSWGAEADFQISGVPATVQANGTPGTLVLLSKSPYTGPNSDNPPTITANSTNDGYFTAVAGSNNIALAQVPGSGNYYMTCWVVNANGDSVSIARTPANGSSGPIAALPNQTIPVACQ